MFQVPGKHVLFLLLGGLLIQILSGAWAFVLVRFNGIEMSDGGSFILIVLLPPMLLLLAWGYFYMARFEVRGDPWFGLLRLDRWALGAGALIVVVGVTLSVGLTLVFHALLGQPRNPLVEILLAGAKDDALLIAAFVFFGVLIAPLWEELMFRGALYGWLRTRLGILSSAAIAGALHAAIHLDVAAMPALFVLFTLFAIVYEHLENLWVPILAHATNNLLAVLAVLAGLEI